MAAPVRDPYVVLGVSPTISDDELHAAYRRLVHLHHPDHNQGSTASARRFEEIQEAYARVRRLRADRPAADRGTSQAAADPDIDSRLEDLERQVRSERAARERERAQAAREQARQAAREAQRAAQTGADDSKRPSDEELGYVTTDDSFGKILADAYSELSDRVAEAHEPDVRHRVADVLDELSKKLKRDAG